MSTDHVKLNTPCAVIFDFDVDPANCAQLMEETIEAGEHLRRHIPGFLEARMMSTEANDRVTVYAAWESRHHWSQSQWDECLGKALVKFHSTAKAVSFRFYTRREVAQGHVDAGDESSPLDGILDNPAPRDGGVGSLDKALWDSSRARSEVERSAES